MRLVYSCVSERSRRPGTFAGADMTAGAGAGDGGCGNVVQALAQECFDEFDARESCEVGEDVDLVDKVLGHGDADLARLARCLGGGFLFVRHGGGFLGRAGMQARPYAGGSVWRLAHIDIEDVSGNRF